MCNITSLIFFLILTFYTWRKLKHKLSTVGNHNQLKWPTVLIYRLAFNGFHNVVARYYTAKNNMLAIQMWCWSCGNEKL